MIYVAGLCAFFAIVCAIQVLTKDLQRKRLLKVPTVAASEVAEFAKGNGSECDVVGVARPGPKGVLTAPFSGETCVWWSTTTWETTYNRDPSGDLARNEQGDYVLSNGNHRDESSAVPILVEDATGHVFVLPDGAQQDGLTQSFTSREPFPNGHPEEAIVTTEQLIPEGQQLFVSGLAVMTPMGPGLQGSSFTRQLVISTRGESQMLDNLNTGSTDSWRTALVLAVAAIAFGVAALIW